VRVAGRNRPRAEVESATDSLANKQLAFSTRTTIEGSEIGSAVVQYKTNRIGIWGYC